MIDISRKEKDRIVAAVDSLFAGFVSPIDTEDVEDLLDSLDVEDQDVFEKDRCNHIIYNHGETKLCIYPVDYPNIVVKIPIRSEDFSPFGDSDYDFCQFEAEFFKKAEETGISSLFAETEYIGCAHGFSIYIQEKIDEVFKEKRDDYYENNKEYRNRYFHREDKYNHMSYWGWINNVVEEELEEEIGEEIENDFYDDLHPLFIKDVVKTYGIAVFHTLVSFLRHFGIDDLHTGNVGYIKDRPVLFDYSGVDAYYSKGE